MKLVLPGSDTIALGGQTVDQLIRAGSGDAALLYLYLLRAGGSASAAEAARTLGKSRREIESSMALLTELGLLSCGDRRVTGASGAGKDTTAPRLQKEETPEYTTEDIKRELENGSVFYSLVQEVQKNLGKLLSSDDLIKLFGIYDSLGLPPEVILHLVTYCIDEHQRRYGPGRVPTMRYIENTAFTWEREGIVTLEEAERYIKGLEARRTRINEIKKVLQIKDRELSSSERRYVDGWITLGFSIDVIELAYDRTLVKTGKLAWPYMDSILTSWHQKGLRTVKDIEEKDKKGAAAFQDTRQKAHKPSAPTRSDIQHMRKFLEKLREE
jgi:DnaD/phage-associated family protein